MSRRRKPKSPDAGQWFQVEEDLLIIGISGELSETVGEIVDITSPEEGDRVNKGEEIIHIAGSDDDFSIISPIDGTIVEVNDTLENNLRLLKKDPTHQEWLVKIEPEDEEDLATFQ